MKKKWIEYITEFGDNYIFFKDLNEKHCYEEELTEEGDVVIYRKEMFPSDFVCVSIIPAARIIDDVKNQIGYEYSFYLKIETLNDDWFCISGKSFEKTDIIKLASDFTGLNKMQAERLWKAKKLGNINSEKLKY